MTKLIDTEQALAELSFDQLLAPVRRGFDSLSDDMVENAVLDHVFSIKSRTLSEAVLSVVEGSG